MTLAKNSFDNNIAEAQYCLDHFDATAAAFALRHIWIICVSSLDLYMTQLVSEAGLRWIERTPPILTPNLNSVPIPLGRAMLIQDLSPSERLVFYRDHVYTSVQFTSFYRPNKISEALSYIWVCPAKEKWARVTSRMKSTGRYSDRTEQDIRDQLDLIGVRRDLIAHSADTPPGAATSNPVVRSDAALVSEFITDLVAALDEETEYQLTSPT